MDYKAETERARFELWAKSFGLKTKRAEEAYVVFQTCCAWEAWRAAVEFQELEIISEIADRSGMDLSCCRQCGKTVICIPDGLALCKQCAEKAGD